MPWQEYQSTYLEQAESYHESICHFTMCLLSTDIDIS